MSKKIMVWNDQKDKFSCKEILLFKPLKFKARKRETGNSWKTITDNLNSLDGFKVDARAVKERYGVFKAQFEAKRKRRKKGLWY